MVKFLHTADWQIGMRAAHVGQAGDMVREQRLKTARRVVAAAAEHAAEFMLVAGDTFEDNAVEPVLVQKVADILAEFSGDVYLIPGNHDPLVPGAVWDHPAWRSHGNLHVLTEASCTPVPGGVLFASPLREKRSLKDPTRWINARDASGVAIGAAHGTVEGAAEGEIDYPIARDAAARAGLDYLALGHWHSTAFYPDGSGAVRMAYSGAHETTKFGERDSGNALLVEVAQRGAPPKVDKLPVGQLHWRRLEEEIREPGDLERLRRRIEQLDQPGATLLDIRLAGVLHPADHNELSRIEQIMASRFLFGRVADASLLPQPEDESWLADLPAGVLREAAERLRELSDPSFSGDRPDYASPPVAARALIELYSLALEAPS